MPGVPCAGCGYAWNLPENARCGRCLRPLAPAAPVVAAPRPSAPLDLPRNARELICFVPALVGVISGGVVGGAIGGAASILLLRVVHGQADPFTRGMLMAGIILGSIVAQALALMVLSTLWQALGIHS